jgi:HK97 family phage major capsid protein
LTAEQLGDLFSAGKNQMSFATTVGEGQVHNKSLGAGGTGIHTKAALGEGAPGSLLPPILLPQAFTLRLEPTRIAEYFPAIAAEGQSVSWVQHTSNTLAASAMAVAELQQKPDIGAVVASKTTHFTVVAGMATVSRQLFTDFEDVASFMPREIGKQVILGENFQLLQGDGTGTNQLGLLNQTGTLTRTYSSTGGDTPIDCVLEAVNDIRVGNSYATADLIILNPSDWTLMRKIKTSFGSYVLDPNDPNTLGGIDNLFGVRVVTSTQCPAGQGVVMDSKIAVNIFRRWNLEVTANPYSDSAFGTNAIIYRGETRFGLGVVYPQAVNLLSALDA